MIVIDKVLDNERKSRALTGVNKLEFDLLLPVFEQIYKGTNPYYAGRGHTLETPKDKLFFLLYYLKTYETLDVIGVQYDVDKSRVSRWIDEYLPLLVKALDRLGLLPEREIRDKEHFQELFPEVKDIFIDGVERRIRRPQSSKAQRKHYSGKKKFHTKKTSQ